MKVIECRRRFVIHFQTHSINVSSFERLADDTKRKTYRFLFIGLIYKEVLWLSSLAQVLDFNIQPYTMDPNNQLSTSK